MKQRYRLYRRGGNGRFYIQDNTTGKQESLGTSDRVEAQRLLHVRNEAAYQPGLNSQIARAYLAAGDPEIGRRSWQYVMDAMRRSKEESAERTRERYESAFREQPFDRIRSLVVIETRPENILDLLRNGTVSTNMYMRRLHAFALSMGWLPWPILSFKQWPPRRFEPRRATTEDEAARLIAVEKDPEWKAFLELIWHVGAAQVDLAALTAENVDWANRTISYRRRKTGTLAIQRFGPKVEVILQRIPDQGPLFPHYSQISSADRATRFAKRWKELGITGVSLHSYRYAWAERARAAGYPERYAMEALGHSSSAVSRFYAKGRGRKCPRWRSTRAHGRQKCRSPT
jgi:integrase